MFDIANVCTKVVKISVLYDLTSKKTWRLYNSHLY